jgi:hypothetical protein
MKKSQYLKLFAIVPVVLFILSCNNAHKIRLMAPSDKVTDQNVITARLTWSSDCDSFDVFLGTDLDLNMNPKAATVLRNVYSSEHLGFKTTYFWKITGYKNGRASFSSPVRSFTTRDHSGVSGLSSEYGNIRFGIGFFQDANGTEVKAAALDSFEELYTYKYEDMYDVSPMVERTKDGTWLILEHERANGRIKALYLSNGEEA